MENNFIAKIEGHGSLEVDWNRGKVQLNVHEGERLFEGLLVGRTAEEMHWITPRICGVCPTAHNLASLMALESALEIKVDDTTKLLRELMQCGQMIQSHVLHLFFLSLPDYLGIDRGTELAIKNPEIFGHALALKEMSDEIVQVVGGRNVHPTTTTIGGFHKAPSRKRLEKLLAKIEQNSAAARTAADLCVGIEWPQLRIDLQLAALRNDRILSVSSLEIEKKQESLAVDYKKNIEEEVKEYSTAKFGKYQGKETMVGALARLAISGEYDREKYRLDFANPFCNNFAQAVEILIYQQKAKEILRNLVSQKEFLGSLAPKTVGAKPLSKNGIGYVEAPRGGLYHEVELDKKMIIKAANIITPTVQNLTAMEKSAQALLEQHKDRPQQELERLLNMLVRAYDPCITCSVH